MVAHLFIPKVICAQGIISSAKRPQQQSELPIETPYFLQSLKISLIKRLKRIGESGQP